LTLTTGLELELLLPAGMGRLELLERLRPLIGGVVEPFDFPSKVPVPHGAGAGLEGDAATEAVMAAMQDVADHHQAKLHSISSDARFFYLSHRCGRLVGAEGATLLEVVHDNTIAGGERVAEVITPPLEPERVGWLRDLVERLAAVEGIEVPRRAALHVHVDAGELRDVEALARLVSLYFDHQARLRRWLRTPGRLHADQPMPRGLVLALQRAVGQPWAEVRPALAHELRDKRCGLNLYNLLHDVPDKLTVELKLAAASLVPDRVLAVRELFLRLVLLALALDAPLPRGEAALRQAIDPGGEVIPVLTRP